MVGDSAPTDEELALLEEQFAHVEAWDGSFVLRLVHALRATRKERGELEAQLREAQQAEQDNARLAARLAAEVGKEHSALVEAQGQLAVLRNAIQRADAMLPPGDLRAAAIAQILDNALAITGASITATAFVERVRAEEREACAKLADLQPDCCTLAKRIRARRTGEKG